ncbi:MAG: class I SAM-dependent methyltransferase [Myxococcota bacterium]
MLERSAEEFRNFERLLELELGGKSEYELYDLAFSRVLKPDPISLLGVDAEPRCLMLGTDQRDYAVPRIAEWIAAVKPGGRLLDLGSGDGQTIGHAVVGREDPLTLLPLDPSEGALAQYADRVEGRCAQVSVPDTIQCTIDEFVAGGGQGVDRLGGPVDLVLLQHSIYFASDLRALFRALHSALTPGGRIVVVFAERGGQYSTTMSRDFWATQPGPQPTLNDGRWSRFDQFFGVADDPGASGSLGESECALQAELGEDLFRVIERSLQPTKLFANDFGDLIALALITGLTPSNDKDLRAMLHYVSQRLQRDPEAFGLRLTLTGPRARMLSVEQPQHLLVLERRDVSG